MKGKHGVSAARTRQANAEQRAAELDAEVAALKTQLRTQERREHLEVERLRRDIRGWAVKIAQEDIAAVQKRLNLAKQEHADEMAALKRTTVDVVEIMGKWIHQVSGMLPDDASWVSPLHIDEVAAKSGLSVAQVTTLCIDGRLYSRGHPNVAALHDGLHEGDRGHARSDLTGFARADVFIPNQMASDIARQIRSGRLAGSLADGETES